MPRRHRWEGTDLKLDNVVRRSFLHKIATCSRINPPSNRMPILMFDFIVFGLAASESTEHLRNIPRSLSDNLGGRLLRIMRRDTIVYFGACVYPTYLIVIFLSYLLLLRIFLLYIANAWTWGHRAVSLLLLDRSQQTDTSK